MAAGDLAAGIEAALAALHAAGTAHGDLKPANVVLAAGDGHPVLIDWGETVAGTPGWRPAGPHDARDRDLYALARLKGQPPS
ncbi:MAG: phosphotransferase [Magnetospirillum sp.]|nr:phosphotransferase [Magnetospirillum sp.]